MKYNRRGTIKSNSSEAVRNQVPIMCKSCANHVQIMCKSCANHVQIMCKLCLNHVQIMCKSCANQVQIMCKSYVQTLKKSLDGITKPLHIIFTYVFCSLTDRQMN